MTPARSSLGRFEALGQILRALRHRNYRLFFFGQGISMIGSWMQGATIGWLVYMMTDSPAWLGLVGFAGQVPAFVLAPLAGVVADRFSRHRMVRVTQVLAMCQALTLAALTLTGMVQIWHVLALALAMGVIGAFDIPIRQSFVVEMVEDRQDLPNAIALNSFLVNGGRIIGPSLAGIIIAAFSGYDPRAVPSAEARAYASLPHMGEGVCFLVNGLSYLAVVFALWAMRIPPRKPSGPRRHVLHEIREGFRYTFGFMPIRNILLMLALISLTGASYSVLLPVFARDYLGGQSRTFGFLVSSAGVGAMCGALFLASRRNVLGMHRLIAVSSAMFACSLIAFSQSRVLWLSMTLMVATGFGFMLQLASSNTLLQTIVDDDKRGRVMSFYTLSFMGTVPFGNLIAGVLAKHVGASGVLVIGGGCLLLGALAFARRLPAMERLMQPVYVRMGILPEVGPGNRVLLQAVGQTGSPEAPPEAGGKIP